MSRVLALGDSHGNTYFVLEAIKVAQQADCKYILQLGDFGIWTHTMAGVAFLDDVQKALAEADVTLIFCDGNHENFDHLYEIPIEDDGFRRPRWNIWHAPRGHVWDIEGKTILAMGGAPSIDGPGGPGWWKMNFGQGRGPLDIDAYNMMDNPQVEPGFDLGNWWPQEMITEQDVLATVAKLDTVDNVDIMISHDCPYGVNIPGIDEGWAIGVHHRKLLRRVFDAASPTLFLGGHYHKRHSDVLEDSRIEILAADINDTEQAIIIELDQL